MEKDRYTYKKRTSQADAIESPDLSRIGRKNLIEKMNDKETR